LARKHGDKGSIPTLASNSKLPKGNKLQKSEMEVPVKVPVKMQPGHYLAKAR